MTLTRQLEAIADRLDGTLGVAVKHLPSGEAHYVNARQRYPLASVFKVPLLVELYRRVESGEVEVDQRIPLTAAGKSPGSGVLKELTPGIQPTVHDLATLAIIVSDNTATDMLMEATNGAQTINATMKSLGLEDTSVVHDCKGLLLMCADLDPADRSAEAMAALEKRLQGDNFDYDSKPFSDSLENNVSTPHDLAALFTALLEASDLSRQSSDAILDILLKQQLNQRIPLLLPRPFKVAHKTGTLGWTRNDAGVIYLPSGDPLVFCAMTERVMPDNWQAGDQAIAEAALAAYEYYS